MFYLMHRCSAGNWAVECSKNFNQLKSKQLTFLIKKIDCKLFFEYEGDYYELL